MRLSTSSRCHILISARTGYQADHLIPAQESTARSSKSTGTAIDLVLGGAFTHFTPVKVPCFEAQTEPHPVSLPVCDGGLSCLPNQHVPPWNLTRLAKPQQEFPSRLTKVKDRGISKINWPISYQWVSSHGTTTGS